MDLSKLTDKAKDLLAQRGGTDSVKEDAQQLKDIAAGEGSLSDKAKAAVEALKDPGAQGPDPADGQPASSTRSATDSTTREGR